MFKYKVFFSIEGEKEDSIHGVEFYAAKEVSDAYIYLLIRDVVKQQNPQIDIKRKVCIPLNETFITDIY